MPLHRADPDHGRPACASSMISAATISGERSALGPCSKAARVISNATPMARTVSSSNCLPSR
jgi:hypothetical protein